VERLCRGTSSWRRLAEGSCRGWTTAIRHSPAFHHISCHCCRQWWTPLLGSSFPRQSSTTLLSSFVSCTGWSLQSGLHSNMLSSCTSDYTGPRRHLSCIYSSLIVSRSRLPTVGGRAFPVAAARVWISLPTLVSSAPSVAVFRSRLKNHLFNIPYPLWIYTVRHKNCTFFIRTITLLSYAILWFWRIAAHENIPSPACLIVIVKSKTENQFIRLIRAYCLLNSRQQRKMWNSCRNARPHTCITPDRWYPNSPDLNPVELQGIGSTAGVCVYRKSVKKTERWWTEAASDWSVAWHPAKCRWSGNWPMESSPYCMWQRHFTPRALRSWRSEDEYMRSM